MAAHAKSLTRLYFPEAIRCGCECRVTGIQAHHVQHVLRLRAGERVVVFDGQGTEYDCLIMALAKAGVTLQPETQRVVSRESPLPVTLAQAVSSGERMDYTIQKAVELGVAAVQPLLTERSIVRLDGERRARRVAHWQAVAVAACEQCGRNVVPQVMPVVPLPDWLAGQAAASGVRLLLSPAGRTRLADLERPAGPLHLLAGPEGGWSPGEEALAVHAGFVPVRLGPRVLRTETAALAALAAMQVLWGDF